ncbi:MAG: glycoside hydrolase family 3 C-terminal domain-containing protein [Clostridiales bacterium]|jgi:beta-glucosidase|nr:glycoside hydrolase family 3 C-terminal domain-containing protein [Clostridiales bacterium]
MGNFFKTVMGGFFKTVWKKKGSRAWLIVTSSVLVFVLIVSLVLTQQVFISNTFNTLFGGPRRTITSPSGKSYIYYEPDYVSKGQTLAKANELNEEIMGEGIVMLKNEGGALPLSNGAKVSVFGKNSVNLVYGGSGSGGGNTDSLATVHDSLKNAGFNVNPTLKAFYENKGQSGQGRPSNPAMGDLLWGFATGETPIDRYTAAVKGSYASYPDAALVVFSRICGEGFDLPRSMKTGASGAKTDGARSADDHYLQLDQNETDLLAEVSANFSKVVVIINSSAAMELGFLDDTAHYAYHEQIVGALWIGNPGGSGVNALGRVLNGAVNPSGRTIDTYARNFKNDPTWANFAFNNASNGNRYRTAETPNDRPFYFVDYEEGIYVGYRYYETRGFTDGGAWYKNNVVYPLGYGLSYTSFEWSVVSAKSTAAGEVSPGGEITVTASVKNTGSKAGKDVAQLYYTAPYTAGGGGIEKAHVVLGAFGKTKLLNPGESQEIALTVKVSDMASYDWDDANANGFKGYELEAGEYAVKLMRDAHTVAGEIKYTVGEGKKLSEKTEYGAAPSNLFDDVSAKVNSADTAATGNSMTVLSRADWAGTSPSTPTMDDRLVTAEFIRLLNYANTDMANDAGKPYYTDSMPTTGAAATVKLYELIGEDGAVDYGDPRWETLLDSLTVSQMAGLIGRGNFHTEKIEGIVKPQTTDPDGPVGFTNFMGDPTVYGTCFYVSATVVAATWNRELAEAQGKMVGNEGIWGNDKVDQAPYSGWYAPAVNIHRTPFSGRNWEYYSEDGFLSGMIAAGVVKGAKSKGVYTYVKHFALNDQETNRDSNGILTWADEQTMRELYFKPFELAVKEGGTTAVMSSFNRIGTVWAGGSYALLTDLLRGEWGFKGMVITDYNVYSHMPADQMIRAGGDLNLIQDKSPSTANASATQVSLMRKAAKNILYTVAGSNAMNGLGEGAVIRYKLPRWQIALILADAAIVAGLAAWGFFAVRAAYKKKAATVAPADPK